MPSSRLFLGTRKGLFTLERSNIGWEVSREQFKGAPVSYAADDYRNGAAWACLDHGHWGTKLHRSFNGGERWEEIPAPKYPEGAEITPGTPATLRYLWSMAVGGEDQPSTIYFGTEPGGLFRSDDYGDSFNRVVLE